MGPLVLKWLVTSKAGWAPGVIGLGALAAAEAAEAARGMVFEGRGLDGRKRDTGQY